MPGTITPHNLFWVLGEQKLGPLEAYFARSLEKNGKNVNYINIHTLYSENWKKLSGYSHRFPRKYDNSVQTKYLGLINKALLKKYSVEKPSHIFIYNDCKVQPDTVKYFKDCGSKVIIFLGDNPNYLLPGKKTFLLTVINADVVIVPDTGWMDGLKLLCGNKLIYSPVGTDPEIFYPAAPDDNERQKYGCDILFIGTGYYLNSWGIKRAALLNSLTEFNMKIFGDNQWPEMFQYFPGLKNSFINMQLSSKHVNTACSCAKLYPVVVNDGIANGVSTRVFDCIASGIFTLAEHKKDIEMLFPGGEVVTFKTVKELRDKAEYYLKNDSEMKEHVQQAAKIVSEKYTLDVLVKNILEQI